jgi:hypothetical protein
MGTSYDGVYFYGLLYDAAEGWPAETSAAFDAVDANDLGEWLAAHLGVAPWWVDGKRVRDAAEYRSDLDARCMEVFGVPGFEQSYIGHVDYPAYAVAPKGALTSEWRGARVPEHTPEQIETWRVACERLRAVLPGAEAPGFYFGCSVG